MLGFRQDALASFLPDRSYDQANAQLSLAQDMKTPQGAVKPETARAVEATGDSAELSPFATAQSELQALIERLQGATTSFDVKEALTAVKDFVNDTTNASMLGGAIEGLADMADGVLKAIEADDSAFSSGFSFSFNASFSQKTVSSENFYSNKTSFSFSFSFSNEETAMSGSMSFDESFKMNGSGMSYESTERVTMRVTSMNANLEENPILAAFMDITEKLTGINMGGMLPQSKEPEAEGLVQANYRSVSVYERLQTQFSQLDRVTQANEALTEFLARWHQASDEEFKAKIIPTYEVAEKPELEVEETESLQLVG